MPGKTSVTIGVNIGGKNDAVIIFIVDKVVVKLILLLDPL